MHVCVLGKLLIIIVTKSCIYRDCNEMRACMDACIRHTEGYCQFYCKEDLCGIKTCLELTQCSETGSTSEHKNK